MSETITSINPVPARKWDFVRYSRWDWAVVTHATATTVTVSKSWTHFAFAMLRPRFKRVWRLYS